MAAGDRVIKVLHRSNLPEGGYDASGSPRQLVQVMAKITGTYATGGVALKPKDLGLQSIDHIVVGILKAEGNAESIGAAVYLGYWNGTSQKLCISSSDTETADSAETAFTCSVVAIGVGPVEGKQALP